MKKEYGEWHKKKKALNEREDIDNIFFREKEVWWTALGVNIGFEQDGKGEEFRRPVLILKKFNTKRLIDKLGVADEDSFIKIKNAVKAML